MIEFLKALAPFATIIVLVVQVIFGIFLAAASSKFTPREEFEALEDEHTKLVAKCSETDLKIIFMEKTLSQMPNSEAIHGLSIQMTELKGKLETMGEKIGAVDNIGERLQKQVDRIDEFLKRG